MTVDWRRRILRLPTVGGLTAAAVRAAYWRLVSEVAGAERERLQDAKKELLFELGVRVPAPRRDRPHAGALRAASNLQP